MPPMRRKIVQHGSQSLTVTLPHNWVRRFGLSKGDEVDVECHGPELRIRSQKEATAEEKHVSAKKEGFFSKNNLSHLYQLGYDDIRITDADVHVLREVAARIPDCIGFEVLDRGRDSIHIKSLTSTIEEEFDTLLRKAFRLTNELAEGVRDVFKRGAIEELGELRELERLNNRFTDVCIRILNKKGHRHRPMQMYEVVKSIERIADEFKYICDIPFGGPLTEETRKIFEQAVTYYLQFYELFYKETPQTKRYLFEKRKPLTESMQKHLMEAQGADALLMHHSINIIEKTFQALGGYCAYVM